MSACKLCEKDPPEANGICVGCMDKLGIIEMPPPRRSPGPCHKCRGLRFVRVIPREHTVVHNFDRNRPEIAPMTLTQQPKLDLKVFGNGMAVEHPGVVLGDGMLE